MASFTYDQTQSGPSIRQALGSVYQGLPACPFASCLPLCLPACPLAWPPATWPTCLSLGLPYCPVACLHVRRPASLFLLVIFIRFYALSTCLALNLHCILCVPGFRLVSQSLPAFMPACLPFLYLPVDTPSSGSAGLSS
jgi:hypothetical protein